MEFFKILQMVWQAYEHFTKNRTSESQKDQTSLWREEHKKAQRPDNSVKSTKSERAKVIKCEERSSLQRKCNPCLLWSKPGWGERRFSSSNQAFRLQNYVHNAWCTLTIVVGPTLHLSYIFGSSLEPWFSAKAFVAGFGFLVDKDQDFPGRPRTRFSW